MDMIQSRNLTPHTYDESIAAKIAAAIRSIYFTEFEVLHTKLAAMKAEEEA